MSGYLLKDLSRQDRYKLLCAVVVPRPIALVTTLDINSAVKGHHTQHRTRRRVRDSGGGRGTGKKDERLRGRFSIRRKRSNGARTCHDTIDRRQGTASNGGDAVRPTGRLLADMGPERNFGANLL
jgi:hypothetical protein